MARASAGVMAGEAFGTVSAMRSGASNVRVGYDGPVDLLAVSVDVVVMLAVAGIESPCEAQRTTKKPDS